MAIITRLTAIITEVNFFGGGGNRNTSSPKILLGYYFLGMKLIRSIVNGNKVLSFVENGME